MHTRTLCFHRNLPLLVATILGLLGCLILSLLFLTPTEAHAQAPEADRYEENDTLQSASSIPNVITLPNMTIFPAQDPDYWRILAVPGPLNITAIATPGLDLTMTLYDPSGTPIVTNNDAAGPNASINHTVAAEGYYVIHITSTTQLDGFYELRMFNARPTATPTATATASGTPKPPTATPLPTSTAFVPTNTPTPDLGGSPDFAESNFDFSTAFRIVPGDRLSGLNFHPGTSNSIDNDFFVMAVRGGVRYTCETSELGPNLDTNIILYHSANSSDVIGGNDDVNTQAGQINSRLTFTARADGDVYVLVGYKFPASENIRYPGNATYSLTCFADAATPTPQPGGGSGYVGGTPMATPLSLLLIHEPVISTTPSPNPVNMMIIDVVIAYDSNNNRQADPAEGIAGISVRIVQVSTNRELTQGFTDANGLAHFIVPTNGNLRIVVPFLSWSKELRAEATTQQALLIPAANAPGLIP